jgi:hypothetical protein
MMAGFANIFARPCLHVIFFKLWQSWEHSLQIDILSSIGLPLWSWVLLLLHTDRFGFERVGISSRFTNCRREGILDDSVWICGQAALEGYGTSQDYFGGLLAEPFAPTPATHPHNTQRERTPQRIAFRERRDVIDIRTYVDLCSQSHCWLSGGAVLVQRAVIESRK